MIFDLGIRAAVRHLGDADWAIARALTRGTGDYGTAAKAAGALTEASSRVERAIGRLGSRASEPPLDGLVLVRANIDSVASRLQPNGKVSGEQYKELLDIRDDVRRAVRYLHRQQGAALPFDNLDETVVGAQLLKGIGRRDLRFLEDAEWVAAKLKGTSTGYLTDLGNKRLTAIGDHIERTPPRVFAALPDDLRVGVEQSWLMARAKRGAPGSRVVGSIDPSMRKGIGDAVGWLKANRSSMSEAQIVERLAAARSRQSGAALASDAGSFSAQLRESEDALRAYAASMDAGGRSGGSDPGELLQRARDSIAGLDAVTMIPRLPRALAARLRVLATSIPGSNLDAKSARRVADSAAVLRLSIDISADAATRSVPVHEAIAARVATLRGQLDGTTAMTAATARERLAVVRDIGLLQRGVDDLASLTGTDSREISAAARALDQRLAADVLDATPLWVLPSRNGEDVLVDTSSSALAVVYKARQVARQLAAGGATADDLVTALSGATGALDDAKVMPQAAALAGDEIARMRYSLDLLDDADEVLETAAEYFRRGYGNSYVEQQAFAAAQRMDAALVASRSQIPAPMRDMVERNLVEIEELARGKKFDVAAVGAASGDVDALRKMINARIARAEMKAGIAPPPSAQRGAVAAAEEAAAVSADDVAAVAATPPAVPATIGDLWDDVVVGAGGAS